MTSEDIHESPAPIPEQRNAGERYSSYAGFVVSALAAGVGASPELVGFLGAVAVFLAGQMPDAFLSRTILEKTITGMMK